MSKQLAAVLGDLISRKRATALHKEMEKPALERRDAAAVINEVMEDCLFTTPKGARLEPSNPAQGIYVIRREDDPKAFSLCR
jgi:hypothetical protein